MRDLEITETGELVLDLNGDLKMVEGDKAILQQALIRLKTFAGDYTLSPDLGASLENFIGQPMDSISFRAIEREVLVELAKIPGILINNVSAAPIDDNTVIIGVEIGSSETPKKINYLAATFDLKTGEVNARGTV
jgi:hypothetical protein